MAIHRKHLKDNGIKILSAMENIPDTPEGILLESLLEGINMYYSEELSQKTKRGMNETRLKGHYPGGHTIGYGWSITPVYTEQNGKQVKIASKVVVNEEEASIVKEIFTEYASGKTVADISRELNARGILNRGKYFRVDALYKILRQEKYTGIYRINGKTYNNVYPQILSADVFNVVRARIEANKYGSHPKTDHPYLLKGNAICTNGQHKIISSQIRWKNER
jgi:DNA invertase Pin-like site-specific DNA recombinase